MRKVSGDFYHEPVLLHEAVDWLVTRVDGKYIDATLGGGGHSSAILSRLSESGRLLGIDQDFAAICTARVRLGDDSRFDFIQSNFVDALERQHNFDGVLMDLGVSSRQLDDTARGFSFRGEGPLDMRMSGEGATAWAIINQLDVGELAALLQSYGEEPAARRIAVSIVRARPLDTTTMLAGIVESAVPPPVRAKTLARVFQAVRIAVNDEVNVLKRALLRLPNVVKPGGRVVIIAYHSLEDRPVKRFFKSGTLSNTVPPKDYFGNSMSPWRELTRHPIKPSDDE